MEAYQGTGFEADGLTFPSGLETPRKAGHCHDDLGHAHPAARWKTQPHPSPDGKLYPQPVIFTAVFFYQTHGLRQASLLN